MEIVIVTCLLLVMVLVLQDRIVIIKKSKQKPPQRQANANLPDIMGRPKSARSFPVSVTSAARQVLEPEINPADLDIEYDENENVGIQIPQSALDEVFRNIPDFDEEEEEWHRYGISGGDESLAQGVTYEELGSVGSLLQKENLERSEKEAAAAIVKRLQGTELFSLLENSIEGASKKIAMLLDRTLSETSSGLSTFRKNDLEDFDIQEFL